MGGLQMVNKINTNICLIYWEGFNKRWSYTTQLYPPIGLMYVAASLKEKVRNVSIIDAPASDLNPQEILDLLIAMKPNYVGFSVYINQVNSTMKFSKMIKEVLPNTKIIFGGPHTSFFAKNILTDCQYVDYCIIGEGDYSTVQLIKADHSSKSLKEIPGLAYRHRNNIQINQNSPPIKELDKLPFPARGLTPNENYRSTEILGRKKNFTAMMASRGCPHNCTYCDSAARWNRKINFRSPENVIQEMIEVQNRFKIKYIRFIDDYFTSKKNWIINFCNLYQENNLKIKWQCSCRIESINEEVVEKMKKAGCEIISLGIEFGNERIRSLVGKKFTNDQVKTATRIIKKAGIKVYGLFMLGYPTETLQTIYETIELATNINIDMAGFSIVTPYPRTKLFQYCEENNLLRTYNFDEYGTANEPVFYHDNLTAKQLLDLQSYAKKKFYLRPKIILRGLRNFKFHDLYLLKKFLLNNK